MQALSAPARPNTDTRKLVADTYRLLGIIRRGWRLIAVCVALCLIAAGIHLARSKTEYLASARLLVLKHGGPPLNVGSKALGDQDYLPSSGADSLATHIPLIRSPLIVERALALAKLRGLSTASVVGHLKVAQPDEAARILEVQYVAGSREEAQQILDAVIASYNLFLKDNFQKNTNEVVTLILNARDDLSKELKQLEHEYLEFRKKNPVYTADEKGQTFIARRLDHWDQAVNQVVTRDMQLRAQLELGRKLAAEGQSVSSITNTMNQLSGLGGTTAVAPVVTDKDATTGRSYQEIGDNLAEVEFRRKMAESQIKHLRAAAQSGAVSETELAELFYADPDAANLNDQIQEVQAQYRSFARTVRNSNDSSVVLARKRLEGLRAELGQLWHKRRPMLLAGTAIHQAQVELIALQAQEETLREHLGLARESELQRLREEQKRLSRLHGPSDVAVRQVQEQIARIEAGGLEVRENPGARQSQSLLESIERSLKSLDAMRSNLQQKFEADLTACKEADINLLTESNLRNNIERQRALFYSVVDQLKQAQLTSDYGSISTQIIDPTSIKPNRPNMLLILLLAVFAGSGLGMVAAFVASLLDDRIRTLPELRLVLDYPPVLGMIPLISREQALPMGEIGLLSHATPRSSLAESYKWARTNIEFLRRSRRAQVILLSSPNLGDGKSTTASNVAITLASAGRRVLLVDADLRKPSLHHFYGLSRDQGLSQVLEGRVSLNQAIQSTVIENLNLLTAGSDVLNPAEVLASCRLGEFIEEVRLGYDVVIIDSSPVLAVTDPSIIATVADGILLVIRLVETRRHDVERTTELLETLGIPVLGVVINRITSVQLGYGYGSRYGHGGPYGPHQDPSRSVEGSSDSREAKTTGTNGHIRNLTSAPP
jgi:capsular exopolysaccharide synthesis family protein